jgi:hypothetical protein
MFCSGFLLLSFCFPSAFIRPVAGGKQGETGPWYEAITGPLRKRKRKGVNKAEMDIFCSPAFFHIILIL